MTKMEWYGDDVIREVRKQVPVAIRKAAEIVQDAAIPLTPWDSGALAASITIESIDDHSLKVGPSIFYDIYVEYGTGEYAENGKGRITPWTYKHPKYGWVTTRGMVAQPYLRPAADNNREKVAAELGVIIGHAVTAGAN
jgi:HK97 gp10 family phage protein